MLLYEKKARPPERGDLAFHFVLLCYYNALYALRRVLRIVIFGAPPLPASATGTAATSTTACARRLYIIVIDQLHKCHLRAVVITLAQLDNSHVPTWTVPNALRNFVKERRYGLFVLQIPKDLSAIVIAVGLSPRDKRLNKRAQGFRLCNRSLDMLMLDQRIRKRRQRALSMGTRASEFVTFCTVSHGGL